MSFREPHELHTRRKSRNIGLGLALAFFIAVVFGLTIAKVTNGNLTMSPSAVSGTQGGATSGAGN